MKDLLAKDHNQRLEREKVFRDPIHDYIHVQDQLILALINTREMQRLRRIKQLGTSSYTFHGAEHTRFGHSLGVYELTRRIISNFNRNYPSTHPEDGLWRNEERLVALAAALLHDVGHGPFSHTFEGIFNTRHEAITQDIILFPETEVHQVLAAFDESLPEKVAAVINGTYANKQVVQLISSQIDADRMDYLLRDAYYAGVSYGTFDLTRILRVMRPYQGRILFDFSGMHAIEDYIVSRYQMYMQVYFHPVSRGMEVLLSNLLSRARHCYTHTPEAMVYQAEYLLPFLSGQWTLEDYLRLDDHTLSSYFTHWLDEKDPILANLAYRFLNRKPFKSILTTTKEKAELTTAVQNELRHKGYDPTYYYAFNSSYDTPYDYFRPYSSNYQTQIDLITRRQQIVELSQVSLLVKSLTGEERGDQRLYFPREILVSLLQAEEAALSADEKMIQQAYLQETNDVTYHLQERLF